jgi:multidrug efflux pump subunit AcrA (membrane-fusion protein)
VQSAELDLSAPPARIESVAQEILDAVANANGIVDHSNVTQGAYGEANFSLRIPSASLSQTLNQLSSLAGARVLSRSDDSQDINGQYVSTRRALADAQALRAALLRQLAAAVTQAQIDSLKTRIHDAENAIAADQAALSSLNSRIDFSRVTVTVVPRGAPAPVSHGGGGFTLGHASHVAGRVLVVAAGVSLIGLAALVPVGLLATLLVWIGSAVRRRRREHALT